MADNLTDRYNVSLTTSTIIFSIILATVFGVWFASEKTLSIHTIFTTRREAFYWAAILFTFALGTAAGDLAAERLSLGFWRSALMFAGMIGAVAVAMAISRDTRSLYVSNRLAGTIAVIDYKTGRVSTSDWLSERPDAP